jgi:ornithine--oxo-acid transaminase
MNAQDLMALERQYGAHNYEPLEVVLSKGQGVWVEDVDGNRYLDCLSGYSALSQGHVHPKILQALIDQAQKLTLTARAFYNDQLPLLFRDICQLTGFDMAITMNSGAEGVETALKLARKWGYEVKGIPKGKAEIITAANNFHGRTITIISFSTEDSYKDPFGPLTPGFVTVPYGDAAAIRRAITPYTAAVLLEPIQGEGGVIVPPPGYLTEVREICSENDVLFVDDEIQTGLGRTGKMFAVDHESVRPDMMILGKALSGGFYPISAVVADRPIMGLWQPGEHGSTFGGNPLASAVARAAIQVIVDEHLADNAAVLGDYFSEALSEIRSPNIQEVRGKGLLIGVDMKPEAGPARIYSEKLLQQGILAKDTHDTVIRFAPPLIIDRETIDWALPRIEAAFTSA